MEERSTCSEETGIRREVNIRQRPHVRVWERYTHSRLSWLHTNLLVSEPQPMGNLWRLNVPVDWSGSSYCVDAGVWALPSCLGGVWADAVRAGGGRPARGGCGG